MTDLTERATKLLEALARGECPCGRPLRDGVQMGRCYVCACGQRFQGRKPK